MARNRWGVEIKAGHFVRAKTRNNDEVEGRVKRIDTRSDYAKAYGPLAVLDSGFDVSLDDIVYTLGPMKVGRDGTVKQNPLTRVRIKSPSQLTKEPPTKRLIKRRKATQAAPEGFYANPVDDDELRDGTSYGVKATKAAIYKRTETLASYLKMPFGKFEHGGLGLDVAMGGYRLIQYSKTTTGERDLSGRLKPAEMLMFLDGAIMVARAVK